MGRVLKGEKLVSTDELFEIVEDGSPAHGNVEAVLTAMRRLRFANLICSRSSRQRDMVVAMVAARILNPQSKLATSRSWATTTLSDMLGIGDADEGELYQAMDWLLERQQDIESHWNTENNPTGLAKRGVVGSTQRGSPSRKGIRVPGRLHPHR